jgi:energy-coupling factor transporter ATP-binding protein EcfA2
MDKTQALQNLLNGIASEDEINLLKGGLASGEISIGGNVNQSVIIIGSGNTVELPPAALDRLGGRSLLGDLDRDLTGDEIAIGLNHLEAKLPIRAPILLTQLQEQTRRLRPTLKTNPKSLSDHARKERVEALAQINSLCMEALDISFNALCLGEEPPEYDSRSPFRGLESFRPEDSEFFFGREALTKKLVAKIQSHPFLAVLGASGSGKSSLVMAGLIPALGSEYIIFRPGTNPLEALDAVKENALVVVDQFEELFTLTRNEATRKEFITKLLEISKQNKIVLTLRSDFLGEVAAYRNLNEEVQIHLENVPPMNMDELRRAMEGQAGVVGLRFEADLSQQILDDVEGEPGAMPLLQHALWELWNRRHGHNLRASEYRAFGGVKQAITSTAEKVYGECTNAEQEQIRDIFLRLTRLDESDERRDTRRSLAVNDLIPSGQDTASITLLLEKLANARLVVKTFNEDKTEIEVAHEALIRHWERLRGWLNEDRNNLQLRESVSEDAREWENAGRDESLLNHRGGRLEDALSLGDNSRYGLTEIEQAYLKACVSLRNKEQRERERRLRWTVTASIAAAIIFLILGGFGLVKSNDATARANDASTAQAKAETNANVAATAQAEAETKAKELMAVLQANRAKTLRNEYITDLSLEMALDAREKNPTSLEIQRTLTELALAPGIFKRTDVNAGSIFSLALSDDGTLLGSVCKIQNSS